MGCFFWWSRLPPAMKPNPLLWVLADHFFDRLGAALRILDEVSGRVTRVYQVYGRQHLDDVLVALPYTPKKHRDNYCTCLLGQAYWPGGGASGDPKEVYEHAEAMPLVLVCRNGEDFPSF